MNLRDLIKEIKMGSVAAQENFFNLTSDRFLLLCRRYVKNLQDAEERMLDGFYKFFETIASFQYINDASLFAWLKKIMINECLVQLRKKNAFNMVSETEADDIPINDVALDNLATIEILNVIVQLPLGYRTVFNLYVVEGMEHKEIASLLGISEGSSKSQLWKAKNLLQKMLVTNGNEYAKQQSK